MAVLSFVGYDSSIPPSPQGLIDVEKEVAKLVGKKAELEKQIEKLSEKLSKGDYKEKVPIKVQEQDAEKVGTGKDHLTGLWMTKPLSGFFFPPPPLLIHSYARAKLSWKR